MYNVYIRYFDNSNDIQYKNINKIYDKLSGEFSNDEILNFEYSFRANLYLYSDNSTYIIYCKDIRTVEIEKIK